MSLAAGNYDIEFPKIAVVRFHSRRMAAVTTAAVTFVVALGVIFCATLLTVATTAVNRSARHDGDELPWNAADRFKCSNPPGLSKYTPFPYDKKSQIARD